MKKPKKIWIAKDWGYNTYTRKPTKKDYDCGVWINTKGYICSEAFESITGIKLKYGQYRQIEVKQIGDVWEPFK